MTSAGGMTTYAFIPARAGSKRVPDKNWSPTLDGRSLVDIAIQCARLAGVDEIVVSTDAEVDLADGVTLHRRKPEHATDHAQIEDAILDWAQCKRLKPDDRIVLLQPTSPLRRPSTVRRCVRADGPAATVTEDRRAPFRGSFTLTKNSAMRGHMVRPRSQDIEPVAEENGAVYASRWDDLRYHGSRIPGVYSAVTIPWWEAFEIDTPEDVEVAQALWPAFGGRP